MQNILFLTEHSPFKTISGAHQRTNFLCTAFSKIAHVDVLTLENDTDSNIENCSKIEYNAFNRKNKIACFFLLFIPPFIIIIFNLFRKFSLNIIGKKNNHLSKIVKNLRKEKSYDYVFVRNIKHIPFFGIKPNKKVILDIDDLPEQIYQSKISFNTNINYFFKLYYQLCSRLCAFYTNKIVNNVLIAYLPNKNQCCLYKNAVYLPNIPYLLSSDKSLKNTENQILFVGNIEYQPNISGLEHFLNNIFPAIIKEIPDVNFNITGNISEAVKKDWLYKFKNISVKGFVNDLISEYQNCSLVVVPVYIGAGTNIKVIEALSMGKACVISSFAAKGFDDILVNGKNILIAENDNDFALKVIELLKNREYRHSIEKKAKEAVDYKYSFDNFCSIIFNSINERNN